MLRAAEQLDTDLQFAWRPRIDTPRADIAEFGDFADQLVFNGEVPPTSADPAPYPCSRSP